MLENLINTLNAWNATFGLLSHDYLPDLGTVYGGWRPAEILKLPVHCPVNVDFNFLHNADTKNCCGSRILTKIP